jgi:hypothetical protein
VRSRGPAVPVAAGFTERPTLAASPRLSRSVLAALALFLGDCTCGGAVVVGADSMVTDAAPSPDVHQSDAAGTADSGEDGGGVEPGHRELGSIEPATGRSSGAQFTLEGAARVSAVTSSSTRYRLKGNVEPLAH